MTQAYIGKDIKVLSIVIHRLYHLPLAQPEEAVQVIPGSWCVHTASSHIVAPSTSACTFQCSHTTGPPVVPGFVPKPPPVLARL